MDAATGRAKELLDELAGRGTPPDTMVRTMANAPALLRGYVDLSRAMKRAHLDRRITERIALTAQERIGCAYCLAAHSAAARELGLSEAQVMQLRALGYSDEQLAEVVGLVSLQLLTGAFNLLARLEPAADA